MNFVHGEYRERPCANCGKVSTFNCCSQSCAHAFQRKKYIEAWLAGDLTGTTPKLCLSSHIRNYLLHKCSEKCEECGYSGYNRKTGNTILQIEHKDGDPYNNTPNNLIILCPNCHAKTETFGALNKGKGRKHRYALLV